jgi:Patatin-like phospholipase
LLFLRLHTAKPFIYKPQFTMEKQSQKLKVVKPVKSSKPVDSSKPDEALKPVESLKPFETIAIAMSGGGFRAAAYNLGLLSYLNRARYKSPEPDLENKTEKSSENKLEKPLEKSLLKRVSFMSSASGGTIPAALYAAMNRDVEAFTFDKFYNKLYKILEGQAQLEKALEILNDRKNWYFSEDKQVINERNLINAFAKVYDDKDFFDKMTFGIFVGSKKQQPRNEKFHIKEVCFNTTELNNGLVFRFQSDGDPSTEEHVGNELVSFDKDFYDSTLSKIKLADILAASSCFPGGFEPFMFPQDFTYENKKIKRSPKKTFFSPLILWLKEKVADESDEDPVADSERLTIDELTQAINANYDFLSTDEIKKPKEFGLIDGGVSDNQGLKSLMDADERRRFKSYPPSPFDLMIISDVDTFMAEPYVSPEKNEGQGGFIKDKLTIRFVCWFIFILAFLGLIGAGTSICNAISKGFNFTWTSSLTVIGLFACFYVIKLFGKAAFMMGVLLAIGTVTIIPILDCPSCTVISTSSSILPLLAFCGTFGWIYWKVVSVINTETKGYQTWGRMIKKLKNFFFGIPISSVNRMIAARRKSVLQLTNDLFMKHIRDEYYFDFFMNDQWASRRMPNMIYDLSASYINVVKKYIKEAKERNPNYGHSNVENPVKDNTTPLEENPLGNKPKSVYDGLRNGFKYFIKLSNFMTEHHSKGYSFDDLLAKGKIQGHAEEARKMPTTLWFDDQQMKDGMREKLIACGQYTTCNNLLVYTYKIEERAKGKEKLFDWKKYGPGILDLRKQLWADWMRFQEDPEFMLHS